MKALTLSHQELTREALLRKAEEVPGHGSVFGSLHFF